MGSSVKTVQGQRLVWYNEKPDPAHWYRRFVKSIASSHQNLKMNNSTLMRALVSALPSKGKILEAGCGTGWVVAALQQHGLDIEGVDYSEPLIAEVRKYKPELPVMVGDVCNLQTPDNYYAGYISIGVIEHRLDGPEPFLQEAYRVIEPGGVACIAVPYFNSVRRAKAKLGRYSSSYDDLEFYQYGFLKQEFAKYLTEHGFSLERFVYYGTLRNFQEEFALVYSLLIKRRFLYRLPGLLDNFDFLRVTHMVMAIARKV